VYNKLIFKQKKSAIGAVKYHVIVTP